MDNHKMEIPPLGYGTYRVPEKKAKRFVLDVLRMNVRHIDCAALYRNEKQVGEAITQFLNENKDRLKREDLWITSKLPWWAIQATLIKFQENEYNIEQKDDSINPIEEAFLQSLKDLNVGYLDLYLIHVPFNGGMNKIVWKFMEQIKIKYPNKVRHIGVSNFRIEHLDKILETSVIPPFCNQFEISPFVNRDELVDYCLKHKIKVVAHSSLTKGKKLDNKTLMEIANSLKLTPAQLLIKWGLQRGFVMIPGGKNKDHFEQNYHPIVLDRDCKISIEDMNKLLKLEEEQFVTHPKLLDSSFSLAKN